MREATTILIAAESVKRFVSVGFVERCNRLLGRDVGAATGITVCEGGIEKRQRVEGGSANYIKIIAST